MHFFKWRIELSLPEIHRTLSTVLFSNFATARVHGIRLYNLERFVYTAEILYKAMYALNRIAKRTVCIVAD